MRAAMSLVFPKTDIVSIEKTAPEAREWERFLVTVTFLGLYGTVSPLPSFFTENIYEDDDEDAVRVREFLDLFHHRLISLFYRTWSKYRYAVQFQTSGKDDFSRRLLPLTGRAETPELEPVPRMQLLRCLGLLTQLPRSAASLEVFLSDFYDRLPVRVLQCVSRWVALKPDQKNALGERNSELGINCMPGERVLDHRGKFRIILGPLGFEAFLRFTPAGDEFKMLSSLVRLFLLDPLDFEVEVILRGDEAPRPEVSAEAPNFLGWTSWLVSGEPGEDLSVVLQA